MKKFLILLTGIYICGVLPAVAGELPKNPWASQNQTVKINTPENRKQTQPTNSANSNQQWVQDRVSAIQRHNAQVNADYAARAKAEQERLKTSAKFFKRDALCSCHANDLLRFLRSLYHIRCPILWTSAQDFVLAALSR